MSSYFMWKGDHTEQAHLAIDTTPRVGIAESQTSGPKTKSAGATADGKRCCRRQLDFIYVKSKFVRQPDELLIQGR